MFFTKNEILSLKNKTNFRMQINHNADSKKSKSCLNSQELARKNGPGEDIVYRIDLSQLFYEIGEYY